MSNVDAAVYLIKHKVRATGDWITIAILGALSFETDPMSRRSRGRLSCIGLDGENIEATRSVSELYLNSK